MPSHRDDARLTPTPLSLAGRGGVDQGRTAPNAGSGPEERSELAEYAQLFWRNKWWMLLIVVVVVGSAVLYSSRQTKTYSSKSSVLAKFVNLKPNQGSDPGLINMEPERALATSVEVADLAHKKTGRLAAPVSISVSAPQNGNFLDITATSSDPRSAQAMAQATAESYLQLRGDTVLKNVQNARAPLEAKLKTIEAQFDDTYQQLLTATNESQRSAFSLELNQLSNEASALQARLLDFITPDSVDAGTILANAPLPKHPIRPNPAKTGFLALFAALGLAVALVLVRNRLDHRPRRGDDVAVSAQAPILATVPAEPSLRRTNQRAIMVGTESDFTRAVRTLRATIEFIAAHDGIKSILVTSPNAGDGKTTTVANLGVALARGGRRVVMVAADIQNQDLRSHFGTSPGLGLTTALEGNGDVTDFLTNVQENLALLDVGPDSPHATELLGSARMAKLLVDLELIADIVLIDAPGVLNSADSVALAQTASATLLVVDVNRVTITDISAARYRLEQVGANVIGAVLNNVDQSRFRPSGAQSTRELPPTATWSA